MLVFVSIGQYPAYRPALSIDLFYENTCNAEHMKENIGLGTINAWNCATTV